MPGYYSHSVKLHIKKLKLLCTYSGCHNIIKIKNHNPFDDKAENRLKERKESERVLVKR